MTTQAISSFVVESAPRIWGKTTWLKIERFQPEGMNVRLSGGQPSYSHVVTVSGTGNAMDSVKTLLSFFYRGGNDVNGRRAVNDASTNTATLTQAPVRLEIIML